jgi:hypothetical protein
MCIEISRSKAKNTIEQSSMRSIRSMQSGHNVKTLQPEIDPSAQFGGDLLHHLKQFHGTEALQESGIFRPKGFCLPDQPRPGSHRLPALDRLADGIPTR